MIPYPDAGFLITLVVETNGSALARAILRECEPPFRMNALHQLQLESLLLQLEKSPQGLRRGIGLTAARLWRWYFAEGFLHLSDLDWPTALNLAITWNSRLPSSPPPPLLLLHPAIAKVAEASHFLSFDPRSRAIAQEAGLVLLPEKL